MCLKAIFLCQISLVAIAFVNQLFLKAAPVFGSTCYVNSNLCTSLPGKQAKNSFHITLCSLSKCTTFPVVSPFINIINCSYDEETSMFT